VGDIDLIQQRVGRLEGDVRGLYDKTEVFAVTQAAANAKLDNMLVTLGELKGSVGRLKERPGALWDRVVAAVTGALAAAVTAAVLSGAA
jgi:hypothetical protein